MFTKKRKDGVYIPNLHFVTQIMPYILPTRSDAVIFYEQELDVTKTIEFTRSKKAQAKGYKVTLFYIILYAALRAIALRPKMNRFISGYRFYQRNRISFSFVAKRELTDEGEEVTITQSFSPFLSLEDFCKKIDGYILSLKKGSSSNTEKLNSLVARMPRFIIKFVVWVIKKLDYHNALPKSFIDSIPFFTSVFFANLGSVGMDAPLHHNFEIGNCGIFCAIGKLRKETVINSNGAIQTRDKIKITITYDDRITDGIYCARSIKMVQEFVENPEKLDIPLELTEEQLSDLGLAASELATNLSA